MYLVFEDVTLAFSRQPCRLTRAKGFSLRWELNFFSFLVLFTNMATLSRDWKPRIDYFRVASSLSFKARLSA